MKINKTIEDGCMVVDFGIITVIISKCHFDHQRVLDHQILFRCASISWFHVEKLVMFL